MITLTVGRLGMTLVRKTTDGVCRPFFGLSSFFRLFWQADLY